MKRNDRLLDIKICNVGSQWVILFKRLKHIDTAHSTLNKMTVLVWLLFYTIAWTSYRSSVFFLTFMNCILNSVSRVHYSFAWILSRHWLLDNLVKNSTLNVDWVKLVSYHLQGWFSMHLHIGNRCCLDTRIVDGRLHCYIMIWKLLVIVILSYSVVVLTVPLCYFYYVVVLPFWAQVHRSIYGV
jgi:hypothetical protein